jgi:hypothetical protein
MILIAVVQSAQNLQTRSTLEREDFSTSPSEAREGIG